MSRALWRDPLGGGRVGWMGWMQKKNKKSEVMASVSARDVHTCLIVLTTFKVELIPMQSASLSAVFVQWANPVHRLQNVRCARCTLHMCENIASYFRTCGCIYLPVVILFSGCMRCGVH